MVGTAGGETGRQTGRVDGIRWRGSRGDRPRPDGLLAPAPGHPNPRGMGRGCCPGSGRSSLSGEGVMGDQRTGDRPDDFDVGCWDR